MKILKNEFTLTIDNVLACPEFERLTQEQAEFILQTIYQFCLIVAEQHKYLNRPENERDFRIAA